MHSYLIRNRHCRVRTSSSMDHVTPVSLRFESNSEPIPICRRSHRTFPVSSLVPGTLGLLSLVSDEETRSRQLPTPSRSKPFYSHAHRERFEEKNRARRQDCRQFDGPSATSTTLRGIHHRKIEFNEMYNVHVSIRFLP